MFNRSDLSRDAFMLHGAAAKCGYDWWWHSFTGHRADTGEEKAFFLEFFAVNPALGGAEPVFGQKKASQEGPVLPLPLGEVAERSEDGEGNLASGEKPSQSPSGTALPEGEPRRSASSSLREGAFGEPSRPSYLMIKAGAWGEGAVQLHRFFGWRQVQVTEGVPFSVLAGDCFLTETETHGSVRVENSAAHPEWMCGDGEMRWDLVIEKQIAFHVGYGASRALRESNAFEMFWHAEGMKTAYRGEVIFNGVRYLVTPETCNGYADKNWGRDFTSPWVWLSSNRLKSRKTGAVLHNSVFDIGGGRPKIGPVALPRKLLSAVYYEGRQLEFNFSKFWTLPHTAFTCRETETQLLWHVEQHTPRHRMTADITCEKRDMLLINYEAPNGKKLHNRLWNGGNGRGTVRLEERRRGAWEEIDTLLAEGVGCEYGEYGE